MSRTAGYRLWIEAERCNKQEPKSLVQEQRTVGAPCREPGIRGLNTSSVVDSKTVPIPWIQRLKIDI